jgi:DNA-binding XRE family transcriptional regulator
MCRIVAWPVDRAAGTALGTASPPFMRAFVICYRTDIERGQHGGVCQIPPPTASPLAKARVARGLTQQELAELAGLSPSTIAKLETGRITGLASTRARVAAALAKDESEVFG